jgi:microfibrillar-associated protein 1
MPNPAKRMTAQPSRPRQRYRPGKAVAEEESSEEEESEEEQPDRAKPQSRPTPRQTNQKPVRQPQEDESDDDEEGFVTDPEDGENGDVTVSVTKPAAPAVKPTATAARPRYSSTAIKDASEEAESEAEIEADSDEESEEESSSDDEPKRKFQRPTFIKKSERNTSTTPGRHANDTPATPDPTDDKSRRVAEAELLLKDKLERDALARAQGRRAWDDDDDLAPEATVDDTDGLDPEAEHAAWRLRELTRLKRDREALIAREKEIEEIERRRNLTAEECEKEDQEFLEKQKEAKEENRGQTGYLARYHHKGAFFQDDEAAKLLAQRDIMGAKFQDEVSDKSALPEYMRVRDMNKLGKKGRTRYRDLRNEDTGQFGDDRRKRWDGTLKEGGPRGEEFRGVDARFLPDDERGGPRASGANASALGQRRDGEGSPRRRDEKGGEYRTRRMSYSRSRSPSPSRRKRSPSPYRDRSRDRDWDRDKRRKVDAV